MPLLPNVVVTFSDVKQDFNAVEFLLACAKGGDWENAGRKTEGRRLSLKVERQFRARSAGAADQNVSFAFLRRQQLVAMFDLAR